MSKAQFIKPDGKSHKYTNVKIGKTSVYGTVCLFGLLLYVPGNIYGHVDGQLT